MKGGTTLLGEQYWMELESSEGDRGMELSSGDSEVANHINCGNQITRSGRRDQPQQKVC